MSKFAAEMEKFAARFSGAVRDTVAQVAALGAERASNSTAFKGLSKGSGGLRDAIKWNIAGSAFEANVVADKSYAGYVEFGNGTPGELLRPKNAKALRFQGAGGVVFRRAVRAHGPMPFMGPAADSITGGDVEFAFAEQMRQIL